MDQTATAQQTAHAEQVVNAYARKENAVDATNHAHVAQIATAQQTAHAEQVVSAFARKQNAVVAIRTKYIVNNY